MTFSKMSHLQQRLIVSFLGICFLTAAIYLSAFSFFRPLFILMIASIICTALWELFQLAKGKGFQPVEWMGMWAAFIFCFAFFLSTQTPNLKYLREVSAIAMMAFAFAYYFVKGKNPLIELSILFFSFLYLIVPLSCFIGIVYFFPNSSTQDGRWWMFYLLAVTKMTDIGAFFTGKNLGTKKLAPFISPKKTVEGAYGGLIAGVATSILLPLLARLFFHETPLNMTIWQSIWLGCLLSISGQFGDLAESLLKRDGGIKDSNQLPGLGGMLDIVDSLIFTTPLLYLFMKIHF